VRHKTETKEGNRLLVDIGKKISEYRQAAGITQTELGSRLGVSRFQMSKHESGAAEMPITRLFRICQELNVLPPEFVRALSLRKKK